MQKDMTANLKGFGNLTGVNQLVSGLPRRRYVHEPA